MRSCCVTDVGQKRTTNQDFVFASDTPVGPLPNLLIVADGMGAHQAGDKATRSAAEVIVSHIKRSRERNPIRVLRSAIETANERVLEKAAEDEELSGMGTTVVAATVVENYLYVANVGDSRLYLIWKTAIIIPIIINMTVPLPVHTCQSHPEVPFPMFLL